MVKFGKLIRDEFGKFGLYILTYSLKKKTYSFFFFKERRKFLTKKFLKNRYLNMLKDMINFLFDNYKN